MPTAQISRSSQSLAEVNDKWIDIIFEMLGADETFLESEQQNQAKTEVKAQPWVLCIDDDAEYSMALKLRLEGYGVGVIRAFEGMEGFRTAFSRTADVILLDYELPDGRGDYILNRLKDNPVTEPIPVIVVTGRKDQTLKRQMLNMGAANYMTKPLDFKDLLDELRKYIDLQPVPHESN